jgi:hypothetical protein
LLKVCQRSACAFAHPTSLRLVNRVTRSGKFDGEFARRSSTYAGTGTVRWRD